MKKSFLELKAPFVELRALLSAITPPQLEPINLAVGQPQHAPPPFVGALLASGVAAGGLSKYPPTKGTDELRAAIAGWVARRFGVALEEGKHILPVCGTREALFLMGMLASHRKAGARKVVFVPDPGYQCYTAAALGANCEVVFLESTKENNFLPDLDHLELYLKNVGADVACAFYLCSPVNPQGAIADRDYLRRACALAVAYDFILITDECYAEIYSSAGAVAASVLEVAGADFQNVISFHSLSKRSNLPGLRSGFCAGDARLIESFRIMRELGGVAMPLPTQSASAAAWADDEHSATSRALYQKKFDLAEKFFSGFAGFYRPAGGFFLWFCLDEFNQSDTKMAQRLWQEAAVSVLPGSFLSQRKAGANYIRIALVAEINKLEEAFVRIVKVLKNK